MSRCSYTLFSSGGAVFYCTLDECHEGDHRVFIDHEADLAIPQEEESMHPCCQAKDCIDSPDGKHCACSGCIELALVEEERDGLLSALRRIRSKRYKEHLWAGHKCEAQVQIDAAIQIARAALMTEEE